MTDGKQGALTAREKRDLSPERMLFFSDGVFAIIITILVLELKIPELGSDVPLADAVNEMKPTAFAFIVSFLIVGMYWVSHRSAFSQVRYVDRNTLWLNLLFLLPAAMLPFASGMVGEYPEEPTALHVYGTVLIVLTVFLLLLDFYLSRHPGLLCQPEDKATRRVTLVAHGSSLAVYVLAMLVATWRPGIALILYISVPLLYFLLVGFLKTDPRTMVAATDLD